MALGYETFSHFYDLAIERIYAPYRAVIAEAAALSSTDRVLDLACGTGQGLGAEVARVPDGEVVGLDLSPGMLARARARVEREGWSNVRLVQGTIDDVGGEFDAVIVALGLSAIGPWQDVFHATFDRLRPGGRYVIFDVHAERWVPQKVWVQLLAGADLDRKVWEPLHAIADEPTLEWLPGSRHVHGGRLLLATGRRATPVVRRTDRGGEA